MDWTAKILKVEDFAEDGKVCDRVLTLSAPPEFLFSAGQFVMIGHDSVKNLKNPGQLKYGSMSIASGANQKDSLELVISVGSPEGITHFAANKRNVGDELLCRGPFGVFGIREEYDELAFVACGTGIAPLISMIRSKLNGGETKPVTLFFGFKNSHHFLYKKELEELQKKFKNFRYFYIMSREKSPDGKQGYVQELLKSHSFNKSKNLQFYLCGPPVAITDVRNTLRELGFADAQVHFEQW